MSDQHKYVNHKVSYDPSMCEQLADWGRAGLTMSEMAARLGVGKSTFHFWRERHPEFGVAVEEAATLAQAYLEQIGRDNVGNKNFNSRLWERQMNARFDEYKESKMDRNQKSEVTVKVDFSKAVEALIKDVKAATQQS
jgi:hypothetical protein